MRDAPASTVFVPGVTDRDGWDRDGMSLLTVLDEPDERKRASQLTDIAKKWFEAHRPYYREAVECTAFYNGAQWGYYSTRESRWIARPEPRVNDMVRIQVNAIKPVTDQATAILTQESPIFGCAAAKNSARDSAASTSGNKIVEYYWRHFRLVERYRETARDAYSTGTAPVLVEWDSTAGGPRADAIPTLDPVTGAPVPPPRPGDLKFTCIPVEAVAFEPGAKTDQDGIALCLHEQWLRTSLMRMYPDKGLEIPLGTNDSRSQDQRLGEMAEASSPVYPGANIEDRHRDRVDVYTFYVRSCEKYPRGLRVQFCDTAILYTDDSPVYPRPAEADETWPARNWPVFFVKCDNRTRNPWGRGRVVDMIGPQKAMNGIASKMLQHVATIANTKVILPRGLDVDWSDEIGQVIRPSRLVAANQIGYLTPPQMPQEFEGAFSRFKAELEYIGGINSSSNGVSPTSDASGTMVRSLQQQDAGRLAPVKRSIDAVWAEIMEYALFLYRRHADTPRKILVVGENEQVSLELLDRSHLAASTDVICFNDQMVPRDPAQRSLWLTQFTQNLQMVQDPAQRRLLMRLYRIKDFEGFLNDADPDDEKARRLVQSILLMIPVYVTPGDDALSMATELSRWQKSREYEIRVESEKKAPTGAGFSRTEAYTVSLLSYYLTVAQGGPPMEPQFIPPPPEPQRPIPPMFPMPFPMGQAPMSEVPAVAMPGIPPAAPPMEPAIP